MTETFSAPDYDRGRGGSLRRAGNSRAGSVSVRQCR